MGTSVAQNVLVPLTLWYQVGGNSYTTVEMLSLSANPAEIVPQIVKLMTIRCSDSQEIPSDCKTEVNAITILHNVVFALQPD